MSFQLSADSFGIRLLGLRCSWWHSRQTNDAIASEPSIFSENHDYKSVFRVALNTYVPIFRGIDVRGGRKLQTDRQTHTRENYSNPRCACTPRVNDDRDDLRSLHSLHACIPPTTPHM